MMDKWEKLKQELKKEIEINKRILKKDIPQNFKKHFESENVVLSQVLFKMEELEREEREKGYSVIE